MTETAPRLTDDELDALLGEHYEGTLLAKGFCARCFRTRLAKWPCETYRLAELALAGMQVVKAAVVNYPGGDAQCLICLAWDYPLVHNLGCALAEYEEATRGTD